MHRTILLCSALVLPLGLPAQLSPSTPTPTRVVSGNKTTDAEKDPTPPFMVQFGRLAAGSPPPAIDVLRLDGTTAKFADLLGGRVTVVGYWSGRSGPGADYLAAWKAWSARHPEVNFVGFGAYASIDHVKKWAADNAANFSGLLVTETTGSPPVPSKPREELTAEEQAALRKLSAEYAAKAFSTRLGGVGAPVPTTFVFDARGNFVGWGPGAGPRLAEIMGNLLMRAGVELAPADQPAKVWSDAEIAAATPKPESRVEMLKPGALAPDFVSQTVDGQDVRLSDYKGKVVILDFWATWCGPCIAAMPHTQDVAARFKDQGVVVLANCTSDTRAKFEQWVRANQEKYPDIVWTHDKAERSPDRVSRARYGVGGIPTQFILDREGRVVDVVIGYMKGEVILDAALAKAGVNVPAELIELAARQLRARGQ